MTEPGKKHVSNNFFIQAENAAKLQQAAFDKLLKEGYSLLNGSCSLVSPDGKIQVDFD